MDQDKVSLESVAELRSGLDAILKVDRVQREVGRNAAARLGNFLPPEAVRELRAHQAISLKDAHAKNFASIGYVLTQLAAHGDASAVKVICRTFQSPIFEFRAMAMFILRGLETDVSMRAIRRRSRILSFAPKADRRLARALLNPNRPVPEIAAEHCPDLLVDMISALGR